MGKTASQRGRGQRTGGHTATVQPRRPATKTIPVYRVGPLENPVDYGVAQSYFERADALRPAGRPGRQDGLFVAPTLEALARWVPSPDGYSSWHMSQQPQRHELRVDPDNIWVYNVDAWDAACVSWAGDAEMKAYWDSGIPLTQWHEQAAAAGWQAGDWEALVPLENILSQRRVSNKRLVGSIADDLYRRSLMCKLEYRKWRKGEIYPYAGEATSETKQPLVAGRPLSPPSLIIAQ